MDVGFSGGPVWSETAEAVVAVTVARWPSAVERESYAIPLVNIVEAYPDLDLRVVPHLDDRRAEDRLRRRLTALEEAHGPTDARSISARYGSAQLLIQQGVAFDEAVRLLRQCLSDTDTGGHPSHRKVGMWWALGEALMEQSRYEEALNCLDAAERLAVAHSGSDDPRLSGLLTAKGLALLRLVRLPEAVGALDRSDDLAGSAHPGEIARILHVRAMLAMTSDMDKAERLAHESYDITLQTFGSDHPAVVRPAGLLGDILVRQQSFQKARRLLEEALRIAETRYPTYHPQIAICRGAVARLELVEGNPEAAFRVGSRALQQAVSAFGDDDPRTAGYLLLMAYARHATGDTSEAERLADRAVRAAQQGAASFQHELSHALCVRAEMRAAQKDLARALADAERGLGLMVQLYGKQSPVAAQPAALVAYLLVVNGEPMKGEQLAQRILDLVDGRGTITLPIVAGCHTTLAQAAAQQGRLDQAEAQYREVIHLLQSMHGSEHSLVGMRYVELGLVQRRQLRFQDAERSIRRGLDILAKTLPPHHPSVVNARRLAGPATRLRRFMGRLDQ